MIAKFHNFDLIKIAGQDNFKADRLAKLAASTEVHISHPAPIGFLEAFFIQYSKGVCLVNIIDVAGSWIKPIYGYIKDGILPPDK